MNWIYWRRFIDWRKFWIDRNRRSRDKKKLEVLNFFSNNFILDFDKLLAFDFEVAENNENLSSWLLFSFTENCARKTKRRLISSTENWNLNFRVLNVDDFEKMLLIFKLNELFLLRWLSYATIFLLNFSIYLRNVDEKNHSFERICC